MQFNQEFDTGSYLVRSYGPGEVIVSLPLTAEAVLEAHQAGHSPQLEYHTLTHSAVIMPNRLIEDWSPASFADLTPADFDGLAQLGVEIVLLGTGDKIRWPTAELGRALTRHGIGLEVMDTSAACRTYNILVNEQRRVAAAVFMT